MAGHLFQWLPAMEPAAPTASWQQLLLLRQQLLWRQQRQLLRFKQRLLQRCQLLQLPAAAALAAAVKK